MPWQCRTWPRFQEPIHPYWTGCLSIFLLSGIKRKNVFASLLDVLNSDRARGVVPKDSSISSCSDGYTLTSVLWVDLFEMYSERMRTVPAAIKIPGDGGGPGQRGIAPCRRGAGSVGCKVLPGWKSGKGYTDKVHQVISGKGESKGKSSKAYNNFENIHFRPVQHLH